MANPERIASRFHERSSPDPSGLDLEGCSRRRREFMEGFLEVVKSVGLASPGVFIFAGAWYVVRESAQMGRNNPLTEKKDNTSR